MKNKIISILFICILLVSTNKIVFATGNGNIDGGGGGIGSGTNQNYWSSKNEGVRVTVIRNDGTIVSKSIDYTNQNIEKIDFYFGHGNKINYKNGNSLSFVADTPYTKINPVLPLPKIISSNGKINIENIKKYFCSEYTIKMIANNLSIPYETLINGEYKLLLEPVVYITYKGYFMGGTATEISMYDKILNGDIRRYFVSLSHQNLPFAMFLERSDIGISPWKGATNKPVSNDDIINYLGLGIVYFDNIPVEEPQESNIEYRTDTEVITSVFLYSNSEINPDSTATVNFEIEGKTYSVNNIVIPEGESQVVWIKWRTPIEEGQVEINVSSNKGRLSTNHIIADIKDLNLNPPPNPTARDRNDKFEYAEIPSNDIVDKANWSVWYAVWHENWVKKHSGCHSKKEGGTCHHYVWVDEGWYDFFTDNYHANLKTKSSMYANKRVPTATEYTMKSGYGVSMEVSSNISSNAPSSHITGLQNVVSYFPEFGYETYWRLHDRINTGYNINHEFKENKYSTYNERVHFSPIWYPNGEYRVYTKGIDSWTPVGMLSAELTNSININGNVYDDWHLKPKN